MLRDSFTIRVALAAATALCVRIAFLVFHRVDSDEPQHLHVVWAWSRGLVQYRDVFDNHFPLLHVGYAPLMALMPESSDVFLWMRLAMLPIAIGCAWLLYRIAEPRIGAHGALLAATAFSLLPPWLPKSVEFRNDTLWVFFWLAAVLLALRRRPMLAGVAAALCLLASVKALPLLLAHLCAFASQRMRFEWRPLFRAACGAAIPLVVATVLFHLLGALDEMLYATLLFNASLPVEPARRVGGALAFVVLAPALARRARGGHLALFALWYVLIVLCFWPSITPRDFLPLVAVGAMAVATLRVAQRAPALVLLGAALASVCYARLWRPADMARHRFLDATVAVTAPSDFVFDRKGDAVFRRRAVYPIYDIVGTALTKNGTIPDRGPERIAATGCCAAIDDAEHIPPRTRAFLTRHFIDIGALRVCGTVARSGTFTIAVPQTYAVIARDPSAVVIDGVPYRGPRFLAAGPHTLVAPEEHVTVIWWRAVGRNA